MQIPDLTPTRLDCDVLVIGGGTAGTMAALSAAEHGARVLLLEKAHVRHSGALAMGMDGVNNAVIPGKAEPEDYVAEITRANDGIVNQRTVYQTAPGGLSPCRAPGRRPTPIPRRAERPRPPGAYRGGAGAGVCRRRRWSCRRHR